MYIQVFTQVLMLQMSQATNSFILSVVASEEASRFLEFKGYGDGVFSIGCTIDRIVNLKHASARETTLHDISLIDNEHHMQKL